MNSANWVILNPYAGRWKAQQRKAEMLAALDQAGISCQVFETTGHDHATRLAAQARQEGAGVVIAAGGDGTISEIVNGLLQENDSPNPLPKLGLLPLGSANDLIINLGLPLDLVQAAQVIAGGKTRCMDIGQVSLEAAGGTQNRLFDNNSAIGFEPAVTLIQEKISWLHGPLRYLLAALLGILKNPEWEMRLEWEGGSYEGPVSMVTVGNNPLTGGLFYLTPQADPFDGQLTFVYGSLPGRLDKLRILPRTMRKGPGNYTEHPAVQQINTTWLKISCSRPAPLHADGEIQSTQAQQVSYQILPAALEIFAP